MVKELHSVSTEMVEGVAIRITSPKEDRQERLERYGEIRKSVKKHGGIIVEEEKTIDAIKLMVTFPNRRKQRKWLKKKGQI